MSGVIIVMQLWDGNVERAQAIYRRITGRELDLTPRCGLVRSAPGDVPWKNENADAYRRRFGRMVIWNVKYRDLRGRCLGEYKPDRFAEAERLLFDGCDLGYNSLTEHGWVPELLPAKGSRGR